MWRRGGVVLALAALAPTIADAAPGPTEQVRFGVTGAPEWFVVPPGVTTLDVELHGAQGGASGTAPGGRGAQVLVGIAVVPGETVAVIVGGRGSGVDSGGSGGFNGGAVGAEAGGGGATTVRRGTDAGELIAIAGGGGGAAGSLAGGDSGQPGRSAGSTLSCLVPLGPPTFEYTEVRVADGAGGGGASPTAPGLGGAGRAPGAAGTAGTGGAGGQAMVGAGADNGGGGGGGGAFGGGGGGSGGALQPSVGCAIPVIDSTVAMAGGSGGGGSSYAEGSGATVTEGARSGDGAVTITYAVAGSSTTIVTAPASSAGDAPSLPPAGGRTVPALGLAVGLVVIGAVGLGIAGVGRRRRVSETP